MVKMSLLLYLRQSEFDPNIRYEVTFTMNCGNNVGKGAILADNGRSQGASLIHSLQRGKCTWTNSAHCPQCFFVRDER